MARKARAGDRAIAVNRKARHNYRIGDTLEAGLVLTGTEVKSLREGRGNIGEAYAGERDGDLFLFNAHIPEYPPAGRFNHEPRRPRKLLVHRRELAKLLGEVRRSGTTIVPLSLYFGGRGFAKVELGLAEGKKQHDKRAAIREREWGRAKERVLRDRG